MNTGFIHELTQSVAEAKRRAEWKFGTNATEVHFSFRDFKNIEEQSGMPVRSICELAVVPDYRVPDGEIFVMTDGNPDLPPQDSGFLGVI